MALISAATLAVGFANQAFVGFPKGYDAYGHMSKVKFLVDNFPDVDWNYEWYSGQFFSEGSFPPLFHYVAGAAVWFGLSPGDALIGIAALSFVTIGGALYGVVRVAGGSRVAGLIAALTLIASSGYWSYVIEDGLYPRILGMAFLSVFALFAVVYYTRPSRPIFAGMVVSLAATLSTHLLVGAIAAAFAILFTASMPFDAGRKVVETIRLFVPTGLIVAYFYVPYVAALSAPAPVPTFTRDYSSVALKSLLIGAESLPLFLLPLAVLVPVVAYRLHALPRSSLGLRTMVVVAVAGAASLVYALIGLPAPHMFIYNFQPGQAVFFAAWFLAALVGLSLSRLSLRPQIAAAAVSAVLAYVVLGAPGMLQGVVSGDNATKRQLQAELVLDPGQKNYRVGVSWDGGSDWINSRSGVPQTRGYQQQGVLYRDWQYWFESEVWSPESNFEEADFLLDWYGVKQFYGGPDAAVVRRFAARPDLYTRAGDQTFEVVSPDPILAARSTRTALVIADDASYGLVLRSIALSGFDSRSLIPLRGGEYVDDHSDAELAKFDMVILYGYRVHDLSKSFRLLTDYVNRGGGLIIEAGNPSLEQTQGAPTPVPGAEIKRKGIGPDWRLRQAEGSIAVGLDLNAFAPATYNGGPWGVSYIPLASIPSWAGPVLLSGGDPVMVAGTLGKGRVVWSGMNLPYHIASTRNVEESRLLTEAVSWSAPNQSTAAAYTATFVSAQLRRVVLTSPAAGVLLKESSVPNWLARVNGTTVGIYRAGPDFMYVPIPSGTTYPATVQLEFTHTPVEVIGDALSIVALVGLLAWLASGRLRARRRVR